MPANLDAPVIEAAGGIVERGPKDAPSIAVIYRERYGPEWALPKGKRKRRETWQQTALREVGEEIGLRATIVGVAGATAYLADGKPKIVLYWRMRVDGSPSASRDREEVKRLEWLTPVDAIKRLSHEEEAYLVRSAFRGRGA
jgi:8-oxo-dGTP pyrophosphatase MutT (NUDIX family)